MRRRAGGLVKAASPLLAGFAIMSDCANAAEGGASFYLLGSRGPMAGLTPPPGVYYQNDFYYYSGHAGAGVDLELGGQLVAKVDGKIIVDMSTGLWVTPWQVLGGNLAFTATIPIGGPHIDGEIVPGPLSTSDSIAAFGDPVLGSFVGWHAGNFHWQTGVSVNVPIGDYHEGDLANMSFNHWATDLYATGTWFDPNIGLELSAVAGITFNGENPATDYTNGTEFHIEWAIDQHLSESFDIGFVGYYYDQLTPDRGAGVPAVLDGFEGRVAAVGATVGFTFKVGEVPVSTRLKYFHEFEVENRLEGDSVFLTVALPLWAPGR